MNKYEKGISLEIYVAECLKDALNDNTIRPTKASSGGSHNTEKFDILSKDFFIECKSHKGKWFSKKVWEKLIDSLPFSTTKIPLYVIEHEVEGVLVMLSFADFCKLLKERK